MLYALPAPMLLPIYRVTWSLPMPMRFRGSFWLLCTHGDMEFVDPSGKPKQLLALQIKTGESWFREQNDGCVIFRGINKKQITEKDFMLGFH